MISSNLQAAIKALKIQDVYVRDQVANCRDDFNPKYEADIDSLTVQQMHLVRQSNVFEADEGNCLLQVFIRLGVRWVNPAESSEELSIRAFIEAEFVAEYSMSQNLDQQSIDEFALKNASYHVWPYWRELLSSQCARMQLPRLIMPTVQFAQNRDQAAQSELGEIPVDS